MLPEDKLMAIIGKRIHPVVYMHAHGSCVPIEMLGSLAVTALVDEKQLGLLVAPSPCRVLIKKLADGRMAIGGAAEIGPGRNIPKEMGIAMGEEEEEGEEGKVVCFVSF